MIDTLTLEQLTLTVNEKIEVAASLERTFWGNVQAIKRPTLLEITSPLFLSAPVMSTSNIGWSRSTAAR